MKEKLRSLTRTENLLAFTWLMNFCAALAVTQHLRENHDDASVFLIKLAGIFIYESLLVKFSQEYLHGPDAKNAESLPPGTGVLAQTESPSEQRQGEKSYAD